MKATNRFVEPIPLDATAKNEQGESVLLVADAEDGSRVAMRPEAQTFDGVKTFEILNVDKDFDHGDKSLVNAGDLAMNATVSVGIPMVTTESVTLSAADVAAKNVTLTDEPQTASIVRLSLDGSGEFTSVTDFSVNGKVISWTENPRLCGILEAGDVLYVRYWTLVKEADRV